MLQRYLPVQHPPGRQRYHRGDPGKALHFLTQTETGGLISSPNICCQEQAKLLLAQRERRPLNYLPPRRAGAGNAERAVAANRVRDFSQPGSDDKEGTFSESEG